MKDLNKKLVLLLILFVFISGSIFAASDEDDDDYDTYEETFSLGDQMFFINGGVFIPLFFFDRSADVMDTNLTLGGTGSLSWQVFLSNHISVGGELGGMFALSPNKRVLYMIPLTVKATYWFRFYPFEIPISLGLGVPVEIITTSFSFKIFSAEISAPTSVQVKNSTPSSSIT